MNTTLQDIVTSITTMNQPVGVLSTIGPNGTPQAAVVHFSCDNDLTLYVVTRTSTRKFHNIQQNPSVAFVIFNYEQFKTVQLEGTASLVTDPGDQAAFFGELVGHVVQKNPVPPVDQMGESELAFIKINVTWARTGSFEATREGGVFTEILKS